MPFSEYQRQVVAYHGCDHDVVATCLRGAALKPSTNDYWAIPEIEQERGIKFQTVRGVFMEGEPLYPSAQLFTESHIQIAVRDPSAIVGFFHPLTVDSR